MRADKGGSFDVPAELYDEWSYFSLCRAGLVMMTWDEFNAKPEGWVRRLNLIASAEAQFKQHKQGQHQGGKKR